MNLYRFDWPQKLTHITVKSLRINLCTPFIRMHNSFKIALHIAGGGGAPEVRLVTRAISMLLKSAKNERISPH